ncbi:MAG: hypothetical protein ACYSUD_05645 [Planctomycetota bacterium]|jgi:hypothetical protein
MKKTIMLLAVMVVLIFIATGCYEVVYTVEWKGDSCIKFEDAQYWDEDLEPEAGYVDACLGDDEVEQADVFEVVVDGPVAEILVSLKAGGGKNGKASETVPTDGSEVAVGDFVVAAIETTEVGDEDFTYEIGVGCDDIPGGRGGTAALSNITFCFGDATVLLPEEGAITILRYTELEEPGEPEEEEEEIEID